jgi:hypothetical protein
MMRLLINNELDINLERGGLAKFEVFRLESHEKPLRGITLLRAEI